MVLVLGSDVLALVLVLTKDDDGIQIIPLLYMFFAHEEQSSNIYITSYGSRCRADDAAAEASSETTAAADELDDDDAVVVVVVVAVAAVVVLVVGSTFDEIPLVVVDSDLKVDIVVAAPVVPAHSTLVIVVGELT